MHINKEDVILGYPAKDMRTLMRQWERYSDAAGLIQETMKVSAEAAARLLSDLVVEGFIAKEDEPYFDGRTASM